jgi:predicted MFS family arabinose efflux permease
MSDPGTGGTGNLEILRVRDFRLVFAAAVASNLGGSVVPVAIAFAVLDASGSATDLGLVLAAQTIALVSSLLLGGVVADRVGRRSIMVSADLVRLCSQTAIGLLLISGVATIAELAAAGVVLGAAGGFFQPASSGLIPDVAGDRLQQANALQGIANNLGSIVGPVLAGVLVVAIGSGGTLLVDAGSYLVSAVLLLRARPSNLRIGNKKHFLTDLRDGFDEVRTRTWLWTTIVLVSILNLFLASFPVLGAFVAHSRLGGAGAWAAILAASAAGSVIGGVLLLRLNPRRPMLVGPLACLTVAIPTFLLAVPAPVVAIAATALLSGAGTMLFDTLWNTVLQQHVPAGARSRVSSYEWFGTLALSPLGLALVGPLADAIGVSSALYVCGTVEVAALLALLAIPSVRTLAPAPEAVPVSPLVAPTGELEAGSAAFEEQP